MRHCRRLELALRQMEELRGEVEAWTGASPVPGKPWTPGEILAHSCEMLPYWMGEAERVLDDTRDPAPFGRVQTDPVRVLVIQRDHELPCRELYSRLRGDVGRVVQRLGSITPEEAEKRCEHSTLGVMTMEGLVEEFISGHLEQHLTQLRQTLKPS